MNERQRKDLRRRGHSLKPVVTVGERGISDALVQELDQQLEHHELVKIRLRSGDKAARRETLAALCNSTNAELIQSIGMVGLLYRPRRNHPP